MSVPTWSQLSVGAVLAFLKSTFLRVTVAVNPVWSHFLPSLVTLPWRPTRSPAAGVSAVPLWSASYQRTLMSVTSNELVVTLWLAFLMVTVTLPLQRSSLLVAVSAPLVWARSCDTRCPWRCNRPSEPCTWRASAGGRGLSSRLGGERRHNGQRRSRDGDGDDLSHVPPTHPNGQSWGVSRFRGHSLLGCSRRFL